MKTYRCNHCYESEDAEGPCIVTVPDDYERPQCIYREFTDECEWEEIENGGQASQASTK